MDMHYDEILFDQPQIEFIYCIGNTSNTYTKWIDRSGLLHNEYTPPNCMILIKAGVDSGVNHGVSHLSRGSRTIIKGIYTSCNQPNENYNRAMNTFTENKSIE